MVLCTDMCIKCMLHVCTRVEMSPQNNYHQPWIRVNVDKDKSIKSWWHPDDKHPLQFRAICRQRSWPSWHDSNNCPVGFLYQISTLLDRRGNVVRKFVTGIASRPQLCAHACILDHSAGRHSVCPAKPADVVDNKFMVRLSFLTRILCITHTFSPVYM